MKKVAIGCLGIVVLLVGVLLLSPFGKALRDLSSRGIVQNLTSKSPERKISGDTEAHLCAIRTALELYHDSEERYPAAVGWSDAARLRLKSDDLAKGQDLAQLVRPGAKSYGYALNRAAAGKYRDDVGPKTTILLFESADEAKDAVGDPKKNGLPGGKGITIEGKIVPL